MLAAGRAGAPELTVDGSLGAGAVPLVGASQCTIVTCCQNDAFSVGYVLSLGLAVGLRVWLEARSLRGEGGIYEPGLGLVAARGPVEDFESDDMGAIHRCPADGPGGAER